MKIHLNTGIRIVALLLILTPVLKAQVVPSIEIQYEPITSVGEPITARIEGKHLDIMHAISCTLWVDTTILDEGNATISSSLNRVNVSAGFGSTTDTIVFTSTLINSDESISSATLGLIHFPNPVTSADYSFALRIIGASMETKSGETIAILIGPSDVEFSERKRGNSSGIHINYAGNKNPVLYDIRGRCLGPAMQTNRRAGAFTNMHGKSIQACQVLIRR